MVDKLLLVDVDGCLLDWVGRFKEYMVSQGFKANGDNPNMYSMADFFGITADVVGKHIEIFNNGCWQFGTLKPFDDALWAIKHLHDDHQYKFVAITSCSDQSQAIALRKANLYNVFGDVFLEIHCIPLGSKKTDYLLQYKPTVWIEDKLSAAIEGLECGHDAILLNRPWNENTVDDRVKRCYNWREIVLHVLDR